MSEAMRHGRMMDDFPLSLTVIVNRAEQLYGKPTPDPASKPAV